MEEIKMNEKRVYGFTLEDLKAMRKISNTEGRPSTGMTDARWQQEFAIRRMFVVPSEDKTLKRLGSIEGYRGEECNAYDGMTNWQSYCAFINNVISELQKGHHDYCYFMYQVIELERFFPGILMTKYVDGYWEVWVDARKEKAKVAAVA